MNDDFLPVSPDGLGPMTDRLSQEASKKLFDEECSAVERDRPPLSEARARLVSFLFGRPEGTSSADTRGEINRVLRGLYPGEFTWSTPADVIARLANQGDPVPTGFSPLDNLLRRRGIPPGRVVIVGGPPGAGKTTLAKQIAASIQIPVVCLFMDEGVEPAAIKIGQQFQLDRDKLEVGEPETVVTLRTRLEEADIRLIETEHPEATFETAIQLALEIDAPVRLVVADSVQTIKLVREQEADPEDREAISTFMWKARHFAKKHDLILLLVAQLNRLSYRSKKDAQELNPLAMFAGSRAIEHASDVAILLETPNENDVSRCVVARNRIGDRGEFFVKLNRVTSTLVHVDPVEAAGADEALRDGDRVRRLAAAKEKIRRVLSIHPGIGKKALRKVAGIHNDDCDAATEEMLRNEEIRIEKEGTIHKHFLTRK